MDEFVIAIIGGLTANCVELPIIWYLTRPKRLMKRLSNPSEDDMASLMAFFGHLWTYLATPSIDFQLPGEAKGVTRKISPMEMAAMTMGENIVARLRGVMGTTERDMQKLMGPMKGESAPSFMLRKLLEQIGPKIEDAVASKVNSVLTKGSPPGQV